MSDSQINLNYVLESQGTRFDRVNKRSFVLSVILLIALFVSNSLWIYYESQFSKETVMIEAEQQADGDSSNYIVGGDYGSEATSSDN